MGVKVKEMQKLYVCVKALPIEVETSMYILYRLEYSLYTEWSEVFAV